MRILAATCVLLALPCLTPPRAPAESIATNAPNAQPLSIRVVAYTLDARIDTQSHSLDATEILTYKNLTGQPLATFPFHLYLNAFQPDSTFTTETHFGGGIRDSESANAYPARKRGSITLSQLTVDNVGNVLPLLHYNSPDDHNPNDKTVAELTLPQPLAPGQSITFRIAFHDRFPESIARNGYRRDFLMGGQWYPKLGVFWHGRWNCHQYHATTEFFSDFGTFAVRLTLPRRYTVGASGVPTGVQANSDGTRTLSFYAEDVGDFAFAASPHFTVTNGTFLSSLGPVQIHVLALSEHPKAGPRYLKILQGSMRQFDQRYGPYPYKILTLIDPEPDSQIGGMEYPTLITGGTGWLEPTHTTEVTAEHEFGHQYWYGMVATNEFEDAWLDEGINSYTEMNVTAALLGRHTSALAFPWANLSDQSLQYLEYISDPTYDPVTRHAWQFRDAQSYGAITYGKSGTLLKTLEGLIGPGVMAQAMRAYFLRYRFTHPTTEDFLQTIEQVAAAGGAPGSPQRGDPGVSTTSTVSIFPLNQPETITQNLPGQTTVPTLPGLTPTQTRTILTAPTTPTTIQVGSPLRPFIDQAVYGTAILDYAVDSISSTPVQWWKPAPSSKSAQTLYRDTVTLHRLGDFILPITVQIVFTDGTRLRERWNPETLNPGASQPNTRWHTCTYTSKARILSAEVDPDHILRLDRDYFNNSYTTQPNPIPARKLTNLYASGLQFLSQLTSWII